jgi:hypothetical protein
LGRSREAKRRHSTTGRIKFDAHHSPALAAVILCAGDEVRWRGSARPERKSAPFMFQPLQQLVRDRGPFEQFSQRARLFQKRVRITSRQKQGLFKAINDFLVQAPPVFLGLGFSARGIRRLEWFLRSESPLLSSRELVPIGPRGACMNYFFKNKDSYNLRFSSSWAATNSALGRKSLSLSG